MSRYLIALDQNIRPKKEYVSAVCREISGLQYMLLGWRLAVQGNTMHLLALKAKRSGGTRKINDGCKTGPRADLKGYG